MFFTKKKILFSLLVITVIGWSSSAYSDAPHPKDPDLGGFSPQKIREESREFVSKQASGSDSKMPERRLSESTMSKEDMFKEFKETQSLEHKDKKLEIGSDDMDEALNQLTKEYKGKIKASHQQK